MCAKLANMATTCFPRSDGNNWSYQYCRRQWSLADAPDLRYAVPGLGCCHRHHVALAVSRTCTEMRHACRRLQAAADLFSANQSL